MYDLVVHKFSYRHRAWGYGEECLTFWYQILIVTYRGKFLSLSSRILEDQFTSPCPCPRIASRSLNKTQFDGPFLANLKFTYILTSGKSRLWLPRRPGMQCSRCINQQPWYQHYTPKPNNTSEVKNVLQAIWADMPQSSLLLQQCYRSAKDTWIKVYGGHFEHASVNTARSFLPNFTLISTLLASSLTCYVYTICKTVSIFSFSVTKKWQFAFRVAIVFLTECLSKIYTTNSKICFVVFEKCWFS